MESFYRVGDLVIYSQPNRYEDTYIYCKLINIIDDVGVSHSEYNVVVMHSSSKNSKVTMVLNQIAELKEAFMDGIPFSDIKLLDPGVFKTSPMNVHLFEHEVYEKKMKRKIELINSKLDFVKLHRNRIDKLNELLNDI